MKSDTFYMSMLFDFYGDILTDKQKELFDLYYNEDLSLAEISEHAEISRQGVRDAIMHAEETLRGTEEKLKLVKRYGNVESNILKIAEAATDINTINATGSRNFEISQRIGEILRLSKEITS